MKKGAPFLLLVLLLASGYFAYTKAQDFDKRLARIEHKLGGERKIGCNEKDSIERVTKSVVRIVGGESEGSGFVINSSGAILTNFHVIQFEPSPKVIFPDNSFETAEILLADKDADIAVLHVKRKLPTLTWGVPYDLEPSEEVFAIGFPFGGSLSGEASVNKGSLAGRRYDKDYEVQYLQTDTTLNPGVSGGPMINICGEIVGMNTAGTSGLGLAISSDTLKEKWLNMLSSKDDVLKDITKFEFFPERSEYDAVQAFYNYLKARDLENAFGLLSKNFAPESFEDWKKGYDNSLDTTLIKIEVDKKVKEQINIKLASKDVVEDEIVYKYYEGSWIVKEEDEKYRLWEADIKEVEDPTYAWFYE